MWVRRVEEYGKIMRESRTGCSPQAATKEVEKEEDQNEHDDDYDYDGDGDGDDDDDDDDDPLRMLVSTMRNIHLLPKFIDDPIGGTLAADGVSCRILRIIEDETDRLLRRERKGKRRRTTGADVLREYRDAVRELRSCVRSDLRTRPVSLENNNNTTTTTNNNNNQKNNNHKPDEEEEVNDLEARRRRSEAGIVSFLVLHQPGGQGALGNLPERLVGPLGRHPYVRHVADVINDNLRQTMLARFWDLFVRSSGGSSGLTARQVEAAIRWIPELLVAGPRNDFTVTRAAASGNPELVSLVPLLAKLGREVEPRTREAPRGGLLQKDAFGWNALRYLASHHREHGESDENDDRRARRRREEESYLRAIRDLRSQNLFFEEDIEREELVDCLLRAGGGRGDYFAELRLRYLVEWHPAVLGRSVRRDLDCDGQEDEDDEEEDGGVLPLHSAVLNHPHHPGAFRTLLELGFRHFPTELGFLFRADAEDRTPFGLACSAYGTPVVLRILEGVLLEARASTNANATAVRGNGERVGDDRGRAEAALSLFLQASAVHHPSDGVFPCPRQQQRRREDLSTVLVRALLGRRRQQRQRQQQQQQQHRRRQRSDSRSSSSSGSSWCHPQHDRRKAIVRRKQFLLRGQPYRTARR